MQANTTRTDLNRGGKVVDSGPGFIDRVMAAASFVTTGSLEQFGGWFGPSQPLAPLAPPDVQGRQMDYPFGVNLQSRPRANEPVTFDTLRQLADGYDLLRLAIETRKDQMDKLRWTVRQRDGRGNEKRARELEEFFFFPDRLNTWNQWQRMVLEELFVTDAPAAYNRASVGGKPYAIELIDGATIQRLIDDTGRTPLDGPAYQQILKGIKAVDYTRDELIYLPRNVRVNKLYGYSPVEQVMMTVNIALRRQVNQLQYYTEGNTPDLIIGLPKEWQPEAVRQFSEWWNSLITSQDQTQRRKTRFVPEGLKVIDTKDRALKDEYDEWLARIICYAFSLSPQALVNQMNRATAETAQETAITEGLAPIMGWMKTFVDSILIRFFKETDYEFAFVQEQEMDPLIQAQIHQIQISAGIRSIEEIREDDLHLEPLEVPEIAPEMEPVLDEMGKPKLGPDGKPLTQPKAPTMGPDGQPVAAHGAPHGAPVSSDEKVQDTALNGIQITSLLAVCAAVADTTLPHESAIALLTASFPAIAKELITSIITPIEAKKPEPAPAFGGGFPKALPPEAKGTKPEPPDEKPVKPLAVEPKGKGKPPFVKKAGCGHVHKAGIAASSSLDRPAVKKVEEKLRSAWKKWLRSQVNPIASQITEALSKAKKSSEDEDKIEAVLRSLGFKNETVIRDTTEKMLAAVAQDAGYEALQQIAKDATDLEGMLSLVNEQAVEWAKEESGKLIKEITETTLDMVRGHVEKALTDGLSTSDLADLLTDSEAFSDSRADMIARTELAFANVEGTREAYKESGVVSGITWQVSEDDTCDECMEKSDKEGTLEDGVDGEFPPLHPNCRCDIMPILDTESEKMAKAMVKVTQDLMQTIRALAPQPPAPINISFPPINLTVEKADASKTIQFTYDDKGRVIGGTTEA